MDVHANPRARSRASPLQHLQVPVGIAESRDRAPADRFLDRYRLGSLVVDEIDLGEIMDRRFRSVGIETKLAAASNDLLGRNSVQVFGKGANEFDGTAGDDVRLEAMFAQIPKQLEHRLIRKRGERPVEAGISGRGKPV